MCSQPLHTAEQIEEVVRSHNIWGQAGDKDGCRQNGTDLMRFEAQLNAETHITVSKLLAVHLDNKVTGMAEKSVKCTWDA